MITTKEVKIKIPRVYTSEYIENELERLNLDVLSWAIIDFDDSFYILNISVVCD